MQVMARTIAIPSTVILLTEAAPTKTVLGTVHGAGNMLSSLARAVGSAVGGWAFGWGVERGIVGVVWWGYLFFVAVVALGWSFTMRREVLGAFSGGERGELGGRGRSRARDTSRQGGGSR